MKVIGPVSLTTSSQIETHLRSRHLHRRLPSRQDHRPPYCRSSYLHSHCHILPRRRSQTCDPENLRIARWWVYPASVQNEPGCVGDESMRGYYLFVVLN